MDRKTNASDVLGIDHVGMTVPNIDQATRFFESAFGAEMLYDLMVGPVSGPELEMTLAVPPAAELMLIRMLRLANGPSLELFEYRNVEQRQPSGPCDLGLQHFALRVRDIEGVCDRIVAAGGTLLAGPFDLPGGDAGEGNRFIYAYTPWRSLIELVDFRTPLAFEAGSHVRRWSPDGGAAAHGSAETP